MKVMIVSEVYTPTVGGAAVFIHQLAKSLVASGQHVSVFTTSPQVIWRTKIETDDTGATIYRAPAIPYPFNPKNDWMTLCPIFSLTRAMLRERPDCLHLHTPTAASHLIALLLAKLLGIPIVTTNHVMPENFTMSNKWLNAAGRLFVRAVWASNMFLANRSQYVTAPTETALAMMQAHKLKVPSSAVTNGVDTDYYTPKPAQADVVAKFGLKNQANGAPRLIYVGRLDGEKRVDLLIAAMPAILKPEPAAILVIVGRGVMAASLKRQAGKLGVGKSVMFAGGVSDADKRELLRWSDIFVIASPSELQCISGLEALACARPIVAADVAALVEMCQNDRNGRLFHYPNANDLADKVISLHREPNLETIGQNGRDWVLQNHSKSITAAKYITIYQRIVKQAAQENH